MTSPKFHICTRVGGLVCLLLPIILKLRKWCSCVMCPKHRSVDHVSDTAMTSSVYGVVAPESSAPLQPACLNLRLLTASNYSNTSIFPSMRWRNGWASARLYLRKSVAKTGCPVGPIARSGHIELPLLSPQKLTPWVS